MLSLMLALALVADAQHVLRGLVTDGETHEPIIGATVADGRKGKPLAVTGADGRFQIPNNNYDRLKISYVGYKTLVTAPAKDGRYQLQAEISTIGEVVVTAQESRGLATASKIEKHAMEHLQPSSFTDILELLPGGRAQNPSLTAPNTISLREAAQSSGQYATSSLGTSFVMDGAPISTNANMQYLSGAWDTQATSRDFTNAGVDMRSIATDEIQSVEVVRGIPSVEYGDLTSGLVKIERRKGGRDLNFRVKADMGSKLFYAAKGIEWQERRLSLNLSADYLNAKADRPNATLKISYNADPDRYRELNPIIYQQLKNIAEQGPAAASMDKVKQYLVKQYAQLAIDEGYWDYVIWHELDDDADFDINYCQMVEQMTPQQVQQMARRMLESQRRIEVTMLSETPEATKPHDGDKHCGECKKEK